MKAMIFAAGMGSRLGNITRHRPKALVEVGGEPMLKRVIDNLKDSGVNEIVINTHHYGEQIASYLQENQNFGIKISISAETDRLLDTGGGLLKAREYLDFQEPFIVHNVDILTDVDLCDMMANHLSTGADVTLLCSDRSTSRYFLFDRNDLMCGWENIKTDEKKHPESQTLPSDYRRLAFGGIHIIGPKIFDKLHDYAKNDDKFSITPFYIENCDKLKIKAYVPENYKWIDMGKPESLIEARLIATHLKRND